ncbi:hypothetical protein GCM10010129_32450 [Streptomyces fumigatiscleroticus]|nr:hypothetical protein GCM10010129_32450 [Streptomyces fumigatiscleroticus]
MAGTGAVVGPGAVIGTGTVIRTGAVIGTGTVIRTGAVIGTGTVIRTGAVIGTGTVIRTGAVIGTGAVIRTGAVIGTGAMAGTRRDGRGPRAVVVALVLDRTPSGTLASMETAEFVEVLDREGQLLAEAAEKAGCAAVVPTCPGWQVRDLLRHTGMVHRWAAAFVAEGHTSHRPGGELPDLDGPALLAWFRQGHRQLVDTLASAPAGVRCWHLLPAPSPLASWARRQAHETTVHRVDAESATGGPWSGVGTGFARDGIDELLCAFHARPKSRVRSAEPRVLRVRATDADGAVWTVRLSQEPPATERNGTGDADCEIAGPAEELYLSLWNRLPFPAVTGDASLAALWRENSAVTWS